MSKRDQIAKLIDTLYRQLDELEVLNMAYIYKEEEYDKILEELQEFREILSMLIRIKRVQDNEWKRQNIRFNWYLTQPIRGVKRNKRFW